MKMGRDRREGGRWREQTFEVCVAEARRKMNEI